VGDSLGGALRDAGAAAKADVPSLLDPDTDELYLDTPVPRAAFLTAARLGDVERELRAQVNTEPDVRAFAKQSFRVRRRGARDHQTAGARDAVLDRLHHCSVDRVVHAEVVAVDDQHPCVRRETQQLTRQSIHDGPVCPPTDYNAGCRTRP
jgi:hypothetical protein